MFSAASGRACAAWRIASTAPSRSPWSSGDTRPGRATRGRRAVPSSSWRHRPPRRTGRARRARRLRRPGPATSDGTGEGSPAVSSASANSCRPSWRPPSPTSDQRVLRRELAGTLEAPRPPVVERRVGRLADPLEQGQAEVAERLRVVGVGRHAVPERSDLRQRCGGGCRRRDWRRGHRRRGRWPRRWWSGRRHGTEAACDQEKADSHGADRAP